MTSKNLRSIGMCVVVVSVVALLGYLIYTQGMGSKSRMPVHEQPVGDVEMEQLDVPHNHPVSEEVVEEAFTNGPASTSNVNASESLGNNEQPSALGEGEPTTLNQLPSECYPRDILSSADLLPQGADTLYAQVNPSGQGSLQDQNFLTAGYHIGINTVGQSLRNANRQLRSEPPNPQVKVSPWLQTTIEPDINRRPLEITGEQ